MPRSTSVDADRKFATDPLALRDYGLILVQLILLTVLVWQFHLEERRHLLAGLAVAAGGFAIHALLPAGLRRGWFIAFSIGAIVLVLGPEQAAYAIAVAAVLIGVAVLPVSFPLRVGLLIALAAGLVWLRKNSVAMFWPIVGSMFMFRLIVYLQSVRHERRRTSLQETCSYFFLLPNAFFPLFPVVDHRTFQETYYNDERRKIYQTGVHWMVVGVGHLLLYRLIWYELLPTPLEIRNTRDVALFLAMNYALYVRISGQFHLICGMLHLFGFNLPRTHDWYFFASSFSDIWRRINIYWKDFMMKTFFFPAFFRARRWGNLLGVIAAVLWVFVWTWLGHSWQVFWLLGDFPFRWEDALLWMSVGAVVAVSAAFDYRRAAQPSQRVPQFSFVRAAARSLQVVGVFASVALFWSHWGDAEVFYRLVYFVSKTALATSDILWIGGAVLLAIVVGIAVQYARHRSSAGFRVEQLSFDKSVGWHLVPLAGVLLLAQPPVHGLFGTEASKIIADLQVDKLIRGEALAMIDGYYEELNDQSLQSGPFLRDPMPKRSAEVVDFGDMIQRRDDFLDHELIPNWKGTWRGAAMTINRWGMRDRDRSLAKPSGAIRIALVGSSLVMGYGVNDEQTFARLLEDRLNAAASPSGRPFEVLNFGVGRYSPLHRRLQIERKVRPFLPDLILYFAHQDELYTSTRHIGPALHHGLRLDDACLEDVVRAAGIDDQSSEAMMQIRLEPHHVDVLRCVYDRMVEGARDMRAVLLYAYLPIPRDQDLPFDPRICLQMAAKAGMETADLSGWEAGHAPEQVLITPSDHHANALGHKLLADRLEPILRAQLKRIGHDP
jgi:hypothetical protein